MELLQFIEEVFTLLEKQKLYETDEKIPLFDEVLELEKKEKLT